MLLKLLELIVIMVERSLFGFFALLLGDTILIVGYLCLRRLVMVFACWWCVSYGGLICFVLKWFLRPRPLVYFTVMQICVVLKCAWCFVFWGFIF